MKKGMTIFLTLVLVILGVGASRDRENMDLMLCADTRGFCSTARCNGYTDGDDSSEKQLKFRFPSESPNANPMSRSEVVTVKRFTGYHHGLLKECKAVKNMFFRSADWAEHMQANMREGIWPNSPNKDYGYRCAEGCKLEIFNEKGEQINKGNETEVWVERDGHDNGLFDYTPLAWSPNKCMIGTALQEHWWKQQFEKNTKENYVMVDPDGLPVFPFAEDNTDPRRKEFKKKFCALAKEQKISVTRRVTKHRPNQQKFGIHYGPAMALLRARNYFPPDFPSKCKDGWDRSDPEGELQG